MSCIGCQPRPFLTKDPTPETIMPTDDGAWDEGVSSDLNPWIHLQKLMYQVMPPKCFSIDPAQTPRKLGRFALKAEAARLLGQVIRHVESKSLGDPFHDEEGLLLNRALQALLTVAEFESHTHSIDVMNQTLMCQMYVIIPNEHARIFLTITVQ